MSQAFDPTSEAAAERFRDDKNEVESRLRPWKAVWPLNETDTVDIWRKSEFPEVTAWNFDPRCPFDRPWRTWTRSALAKSENSPDACREQLFKEEGIEEEGTFLECVWVHTN